MHIGKSGGNSLVKALQGLFMNQRIGNLVQLHSFRDREYLGKEMNTSKHHYTYVALKAYSDGPHRPRQRRIGRLGPLELSSRSYTTCAATGHGVWL